LNNRLAMIGKPIKGTSFRGLLDYLAGRAGARLIGGNMEGRNARELAREFAFSRALRPRLGKAACHIPLRLPYDERLSEAQWLRIGERVMAGMGFEDCSYTMYLHPQNPQGEHLHIVASRVTHLGHCVDDSFDMERLMRIERRIERDYGLREVPFRKTAARRPRRGEYQFRERTGVASERERLQEVVGGAARTGVAVDEFVAALERQGVELRPAITSTGRVKGMRYRRGEITFSGSSLGADFTWPGLLGRRGLVFEAARDLPALVAAGRRFDAGALGAVIAGASARGADPVSFPGAEAGGRPSGGGARGGPAHRGPPADGGLIGAAEAGSGAGAGEDGSSSGRGAARGGRPDTGDQVARQLAALGSPRYDVLVLQVTTGEHLHHRTGLTPAGIVAAVPWLKHLNAQGCEILVRPSAPAGLTHFEGVHLGAMREAGAAGFEAAAVLRAPDGGREVWMRGGADLPPVVQELVDRELGRRLRPGRAPQAPGYGHLAGFTSPFAQRAGGLERAPFLTLEEDGGRVYGGFRALAAESRARAAAEVLEERVEREIAGLGRPAGVAAEAAEGVVAGGAGSAEGGSPREGSPRARAAAGPEAGGAEAARRGAGRPSSRQAALREMLAITDREAERRGLAGAPRPPAAGEIEEQLARWGAARKAHAEALAAAGEEVRDGSRGAAPYRREARVLATFRAQEALRHELAERLGVREVPAELPAGAALALARWQASLAGAEERLDRLLLEPGATASERLEGAIAVRTLREELADAAREHGLTLREAVPGVASAGLAGDGEWVGAAAAAELPAGSVQPGGPQAAVGRAGEGAAAGSLEVPGDEALVLAYDEAAIPYSAVRQAAGWREQLAAELGLEEREGALRAELGVLERAHERASLLLDALEARIERRPTSARLAAHETVAAAVLDLEERRAPLAERVAYLADHRIGREIGRLERILERQPSAAGIAAFTRLLDERRRLGARPGGSGVGDGELAAAEGAGRPRVEAAREGLDGAVADLLARPSLRAVHGVRDRHGDWRAAADAAARRAADGELRAARRELHRAGEAVLAAAAERPGEAVSAATAGPWRRALERYQAGETAVARGLEAAAGGADGVRGEVGTLMLQLRRGDLSPTTLARLQRAIARGLRASGESPGPLPRSGAAGSLPAAVAAWRATRAELRAAVESFPGDGRAGGDAEPLRRLREGVARYQAAAAELNGQTQAAGRTAESRALGPRFFLDHAAFAGMPHRAVAAWSAHATEVGVEPARIPEALARAGGVRMASPRLLSSSYGFFLGAAVTRAGLTMFQHYANEP
jgi:hypothetical protein